VAGWDTPENGDEGVAKNHRLRRNSEAIKPGCRLTPVNGD
jgi:hypothetical protein